MKMPAILNSSASVSSAILSSGSHKPITNHRRSIISCKIFEQKQELWPISRNFSSSIAAVLAGSLLFANPAMAADALKTCSCLLKECRFELARCIADPSCAANIACLQTCNDRPDETECQIKCGDVFENKVVDSFNDCAVTKKKCVPQKQDEGRFPVPPPSSLVQSFNTTNFTGEWFITSGLNRSFDTFDCQRHEFTAAPQKLTGNLTWRVNTPDGGFITRTATQNFEQDPKQPGVLYNHNNEFLHYQDDWYIIASRIEQKADDFVFVYYRGSNDAWDGYGGAFVYTRSKTLPDTIVPELREAAARVGLDFNKFEQTDNTCGPEPELLARIEKKVEEGEEVLVEEVKEIEGKVEQVEMSLLDKIKSGIQEIFRDEQALIKELSDEEKAVLSALQMEAEDVEKLFGRAIPVRKLR